MDALAAIRPSSGPLDSRFESERSLGPMAGSNTVLVGTTSGSLLKEGHGSELGPNALEDDGGGVGIRAPVLRPHAAVLVGA